MSLAMLTVPNNCLCGLKILVARIKLGFSLRHRFLNERVFSLTLVGKIHVYILSFMLSF